MLTVLEYQKKRERQDEFYLVILISPGKKIIKRNEFLTIFHVIERNRYK